MLACACVPGVVAPELIFVICAHPKLVSIIGETLTDMTGAMQGVPPHASFEIHPCAAR